MAKKSSNEQQQPSRESQAQAAIDMSVSTLGKDLMALVLQEIKALPDVWQKLPEYRQNEVIERVRNCVEYATKRTVTLIASQGCQKVVGDLDKITIAAGKKQAVITLAKDNENDAVHELYDSEGDVVMIVLATPDQFTGGMDEIRGEPDQREIDLPSNDEDFDGDDRNEDGTLLLEHDDMPSDDEEEVAEELE